MVDMVTLRTRRSQDRRIGDRRNMIAADRAGQHRSDRHDHEILVIIHDSQHDRNQDAEGPPRGTGSKSKTDSHQEEECREHDSHRCIITDHISYIAADIQVFLTNDTRERPCERQDHDGRRHLLEAFAKAGTERTKGKYLSWNIQDKGEYKRNERTDDKASCGLTVCKSIRDALAIQNTACVKHTEDTATNQDEEREYKVNDAAIAHRRTRFVICILFRNHQRAAALLFKSSHAGKILSRPDKDQHENDRQPCIEIQRNGRKEKSESIDLTPLRQRRCDRRRPGRHRRDDADRRCCRIDDIGELRTGDLEAVCDRTHDRTDRQTVEIVVNKNQNTKHHGDKECALFPLDRARCIVSIRLRSP